MSLTDFESGLDWKTNQWMGAAESQHKHRTSWDSEKAKTAILWAHYEESGSLLVEGYCWRSNAWIQAGPGLHGLIMSKTGQDWYMPKQCIQQLTRGSWSATTNDAANPQGSRMAKGKAKRIAWRNEWL